MTDDTISHYQKEIIRKLLLIKSRTTEIETLVSDIMDNDIPNLTAIARRQSELHFKEDV